MAEGDKPRFRVVVSGDRKWKDAETVREVLELLIQIYGPLHVVNGGARGLDLMARRIALKLGCTTQTIFAPWERYRREGKVVAKAGHDRNTTMLDTEPNLVLAFHDRLESESKGTKNCVDQARKRDLPVVVITSSEAALQNGWPATLEEIETTFPA